MLVTELIPLGKLFILGDLNADLMKLKEHNTQRLIHILELAELSIDKIFPTRITISSQTCLDIIAIPDNVKCVEYEAIENSSSDHFPIVCRISQTWSISVLPIRKRSFKKVDKSALKRRLQEINLDEATTSNDAEALLDEWEKEVFEILDELAPLRDFPRRRQALPWVNGNIKQMISHRNKLSRKLTRNTAICREQDW